jgi:hypothetical protein
VASAGSVVITREGAEGGKGDLVVVRKDLYQPTKGILPVFLWLVKNFTNSSILTFKHLAG